MLRRRIFPIGLAEEREFPGIELTSSLALEGVWKGKSFMNMKMTIKLLLNHKGVLRSHPARRSLVLGGHRQRI